MTDSPRIVLLKCASLTNHPVTAIGAPEKLPAALLAAPYRPRTMLWVAQIVGVDVAALGAKAEQHSRMLLSQRTPGWQAPLPRKNGDALVWQREELFRRVEKLGCNPPQPIEGVRLHCW